MLRITHTGSPGRTAASCAGADFSLRVPIAYAANVPLPFAWNPLVDFSPHPISLDLHVIVMFIYDYTNEITWRKSMKKKLIGILLISTILAILFAGCSYPDPHPDLSLYVQDAPESAGDDNSFEKGEAVLEIEQIAGDNINWSNASIVLIVEIKDVELEMEVLSITGSLNSYNYSKVGLITLVGIKHPVHNGVLEAGDVVILKIEYEEYDEYYSEEITIE